MEIFYTFLAGYQELPPTNSHVNVLFLLTMWVNGEPFEVPHHDDQHSLPLVHIDGPNHAVGGCPIAFQVKQLLSTPDNWFDSYTEDFQC